MSVVYVCDGCGKPGKPGEKFNPKGFIRRVHYCKKCNEIYEDYYWARDDLHTEVARMWTGGVQALEEDLLSKYKDFKFPDA